MPTDEKPSIEDEPPTKPDGYMTPCPECANIDGIPQGTVLRETGNWRGGGYSQINQTCVICWGKKFINRAELERWRQRTGG